jgi:hypothetical protein
LAISLVISATIAHPQDTSGPIVPCVGIPCKGQEIQPWPETGAWYNPEQSGSGFTIEIQNGRMVAYYYGFDPEGQPTWWLFVGDLEVSEEPGVAWEAEGFPNRFEGGNCFDCEYEAPGDPEQLGAVRFEFLQRASLRLTLPSGSQQYMVPITYGSESKAYFAEHSDYLFPAMASSQIGALWYFAYDYTSAGEQRGPWEMDLLPLTIGQPRFLPQGRFDRPDGPVLAYSVTWYDTPINALGNGEIICELREFGDARVPACVYIFSSSLSFEIPVGNFTDSRIQGVAENGWRFEAFRAYLD